MTVGLVCLATVLLLAFLRVPLGIALLTVSIGGIGFINSFDVARTLLPMTLSEAAFSYELAVVPMFILMGNVSRGKSWCRQAATWSAAAEAHCHARRRATTRHRPP